MTQTGIYSVAVALVLLVMVQGSWQLPAPQTDSSSSVESLDEERSAGVSDVEKRHSEGTFSNDYSKYLEDRRAQEFVRWLMSNKRSGAAPEKRHADGTFTSDASSFRRDQAVQDFVAMLKSGQVKRAWDMTEGSSAGSTQKRQVDGTFTSDVNKVLESMAAKEYLLWVMSHPSGASAKRQEESQ